MNEAIRKLSWLSYDGKCEEGWLRVVEGFYLVVLLDSICLKIIEQVCCVNGGHNVTRIHKKSNFYYEDD